MFPVYFIMRRRIEEEMSKIDEVRAEMVTAMKNKDKDRKEVLSLLLSAMLLPDHAGKYFLSTVLIFCYIRCCKT